MTLLGVLGFRMLTCLKGLIWRLMVVNFQVGVIFGDKHLIVDIAVVVKWLDTGHAVLLRVIIFLRTDLTLPFNMWFFLIADLGCIVSKWTFSMWLVWFSWHFDEFFLFEYFKFIVLIDFWRFSTLLLKI